MFGNLVEHQEDGIIVGNEPKFWETLFHSSCFNVVLSQIFFCQYVLLPLRKVYFISLSALYSENTLCKAVHLTGILEITSPFC